MKEAFERVNEALEEGFIRHERVLDELLRFLPEQTITSFIEERNSFTNEAIQMKERFEQYNL